MNLTKLDKRSHPVRDTRTVTRVDTSRQAGCNRLLSLELNHKKLTACSCSGASSSELWQSVAADRRVGLCTRFKSNFLSSFNLSSQVEWSQWFQILCKSFEIILREAEVWFWFVRNHVKLKSKWSVWSDLTYQLTIICQSVDDNMSNQWHIPHCCQICKWFTDYCRFQINQASLLSGVSAAACETVESDGQRRPLRRRVVAGRRVHTGLPPPPRALLHRIPFHCIAFDCIWLHLHPIYFDCIAVHCVQLYLTGLPSPWDLFIKCVASPVSLLNWTFVHSINWFINLHHR